jgi:hypothetical protein
MKSWWIYLILIILVLGAGYYFITINNTIEVDDSSPLNTNTESNSLIINDAMDSMTEEEKVEHDKAVEEANKLPIEEKNMPMDSGSSLLSRGTFIRRAHSVMGEALLIDDNGKKVLRFENFETDNGPNLHIYLASNLGDDDFIDLGPIKATKGNVNYDIPDGTDLDKYDKVLVWCVPFRVLFSYAELE